jgi:hypothetical protein
MSENKVLRRMFGRKKEYVTGGSKTLHNEELPKNSKLFVFHGWAV